MQYGLIGEHLGHSYSVPIHRLITGEDYELREIAPEDAERALLDGEIDKYKEWRKTTGKDAPKVED